MSTITDRAPHPGLLLTPPASLSRADLRRLITLVEAFDQDLVSAAEVDGISIAETIDLIASRRAA